MLEGEDLHPARYSGHRSDHERRTLHVGLRSERVRGVPLGPSHNLPGEPRRERDVAVLEPAGREPGFDPDEEVGQTLGHSQCPDKIAEINPTSAARTRIGFATLPSV